ncbi:MAG: DUF6644 family protein [Pseudomonadota bacterium]
MADLVTSLFDALGRSPPGLFLAASTPAFAAVQSIHLIGLAGVGGAVVALDLAVLGVVFRGADITRVARGLFGFFLVALVLTVTSGLLLVSAGPQKYLLNALFGPKLLVLALALALHLLIYPGIVRPAPAARVELARPFAAASLVAWFSVAVIGRWIGLI